MAIRGPFSSYIPPSVTTETEVESDVSGPPSGVQIPVFVGTGRETLSRSNVELARGSSSTVDQLSFEEDVSEKFIVDEDNGDLTLGEVDGLSSRFKVEHAPIVRGDGGGRTTTRPQDVNVTVDGVETVVAVLDGERGIVHLQVPPPEGSTVRITYSYNRTDTSETDDVSHQVSDDPAILRSSESQPYDIVEGESDIFVVMVDGDRQEAVLEENTSASNVASDINSKFEGLTASVETDAFGNPRLRLMADASIRIGSGSANAVLGFSNGQSTDRNREFFVFNGPLVTGDDSGTTTTDPDDVTVRVNGQTVRPETVDGNNRMIRLRQAPPVGSTVEVDYYWNTFQNTYDPLPNREIMSVEHVGDSPSRLDYTEGLDYVISDDTILWGSHLTVEPGDFAGVQGTDQFGEDQVFAQLADNKVFLEEVERKTDRSVVPPQPSRRTVILGRTPTDGSGRDNPTNDPNKVEVYHGPDIVAAMNSEQAEIVDVDSGTREVTVKDSIPPSHSVFATYYYNRLRDDEYMLTRDSNGRVRVQSDEWDQELFNVTIQDQLIDDSELSVEWPGTHPDALILGQSGIKETVTIDFREVGATQAIFTNEEESPYETIEGSSDEVAVILNDDDLGVDTDESTIDLSSNAPAIMVSDRHEPGVTFDVEQWIVDENTEFDFQIDGDTLQVDFNDGVLDKDDVTLDEIAEKIWRQKPAELEGTEEETFVIAADTDDEFDFVLNGETVNVTLSDGTGIDAATIVGEINTAIDGTAGLTEGDPRNMLNDGRAVDIDGKVVLEASDGLEILTGTANPVLGFTDNDTADNVKIARTFIHPDGEYLFLRSRTLPESPDEESRVRILVADVEGELGFEGMDAVSGAESAVVKPATLLGDVISTSDITDLANNEPDFELEIDDEEYVVDGADFAGAVDIDDVRDAINDVIGDGTGGADVADVDIVDGERLRITSRSVTSSSLVEIGAETIANDLLGFAEGDFATRRMATAEEIVAVTNYHISDWTDQSATDLSDAGFYDPEVDDHLTFYAEELSEAGSQYVRLTSFGTGLDVSFTFDGSLNTALIHATGLGILPGQGANGEDGVPGFDVSSNKDEGSDGEGVVGQTYTDDTTGLRFTVKPHPEGHEYGIDDPTDELTLRVRRKMRVGSQIMNRSIAGVEMFIESLDDVSLNDTAIVTTFDGDGEEPGVGDFYYISYNYQKGDFGPRLFTRFQSVEENFGSVSPENPLSLACYLALLNGASIVAAKQVLKQEGLDQASPQSFIDALDELKDDIQPGIGADILVPLSTDEIVRTHYTKHCEIQSTPRNQNERRAFFGVASGTQPNTVVESARDLESERALIVYPDSAVMSLTNQLGEVSSFLVDSTFIAAALAGKTVSPALDVATPMTRNELVGFDSLNRSLDEQTMNRLAINGVTIMEETANSLQVRQGLTTDVEDRFTATPSIIAIKDYVQQQTRQTLDQFVGLKFLTQRSQDVELALSGLLNSLIENDIIVSYQGVDATPDPNDPTILRVEAYYAPAFPLLYVPVRFTISSEG